MSNFRPSRADIDGPYRRLGVSRNCTIEALEVDAIGGVPWRLDEALLPTSSRAHPVSIRNAVPVGLVREHGRTIRPIWATRVPLSVVGSVIAAIAAIAMTAMECISDGVWQTCRVGPGVTRRGSTCRLEQGRDVRSPLPRRSA